MSETVPGLLLRRPFWWIGYLGAQLWLRCYHRIRVEGPPSGVALDAPIVIAAKHVRYADIPLVACLVRRLLGTYPFFEMGTFEGYRLLSPITFFLKRVGGFQVMRPKDVKRLQAMGRGTPAELKARMREVNADAVRTREAVLRNGQAFCFFPEGMRIPSGIGRLKARHEFEEAIALAAELPTLVVLPVVIDYPERPARWPFLGRPEVIVRALEPVRLQDAERDDVLESVAGAFRAAYRPALDPDADATTPRNEEVAT